MNSLKDLAALFIVVMMLPILCSSFRLLSLFDIDYYRTEEEISLMKLREVLLLSYDLDYSKDVLSFLYEGETFTLRLVNGNLILQPGTVIYLSRLDDLRFERRNGVIYVVYERKGETYVTAVASETGLRIGDFSACDDECGEPADDGK